MEKALIKEKEYGWMTPLLAAYALKLPGLELEPLGVVEHLGIGASGEYIEKR